MKNYLVLFIINILFSFQIFSQEIKKGEAYNYARWIVDTMTSESMHGRGYVNGGDGIAAYFIKTQFQKLGLKSFKNNYYQSLSFPVNIFPDKVSLLADGQKLEPGKDFLVSPETPSSSGSYATVFADDVLIQNKKKYKKFLAKDLSEKILIVNDTGTRSEELQELLKNPLNAKAIVELKDKLTWDIAQKQNKYPSFELLRSSIAEPKEISFSVDAQLIQYHKTQNLIGYVLGSEYPDSFIVFSAHYDHLGQMGKDVFFPGANDNASGCAMLLNLAKYYSMPEHKPKYSIVFIAFCGEEAGLLGSKHFTEFPLFPLKNIKFLLNMDIMGTGEDGITVVNGSVFKNEFEKLKEINIQNSFIKDVKIRGKAANSDHYFFSENGVRAFFIYTMGGIKAYHDIYDKAETLPLNEFEDLFRLITKFGDYLQN